MNHIDIFLLDCSKLCVDDIYWKTFISPLRTKKLERITNPNAKKLSLGAELALAAALAFRNQPFSPPQYYCDTNGKPKLYDNNLHFSLSHTGNYAVCAISEAEVGVDAEHPRNISSGITRFVLSAEEKGTSCEEILKKWVIKESFLKLTGSGIKRDSMSSITAENERIYGSDGETLAYYSLCFIKDLIISCCAASTPDMQLIELSADELKKILRKSI